MPYKMRISDSFVPACSVSHNLDACSSQQSCAQVLVRSLTATPLRIISSLPSANMSRQQSARAVKTCIAAVGLLMLASAASATQLEGRQQPSAALNFRRALRLVVDTAVTEHWGHGQATATATWVDIKAAHDQKEAAKAPASDDTPKDIKETVYLKPVDECDEECIKKFIPDFSKKLEDSATKTVSINKEATVSASKQGIQVSTKSGP